MITVLLLAGCGKELDPQHAVVLEGFRYGWERFNHRLSHLQVEPGDDHARVSVIGGTSTTSVVPDPLPAECDPNGCQEFPVTDNADVEVRWAVVDTTAIALAPATVELVVGVDGASATATVELPKGAGETATALVTGLALSTDEALAIGEACYRPAYGWHPRDLRISLGDVVVDGESATVEVSAAFAAGNTLEEERTCVDEVNEQAQVAMTISLVVAAGRDLVVEEADLHAEATYPFSGDSFEPEPQAEPEPTDLGIGAPDAVLGFSTLDFRFHVDDPDARGAYLRTLGWWVEPDGAANAIATNYSPVTQLSGFSYAFDGTVRSVPTGGTVTRGTVATRVPAQLDDGGQPVVHEIAYEQ